MSKLTRSFLNSGLSSMRSTNTTWVKPLEEYTVTDEVERDVTVYLCRESLVKAGWETMTHWSLFFYFKDSDLYIVYQAGEVNGKLTPSRSACPSLPQSDEQKIRHGLIGTLTISQAALHRAALANHLSNERYCLEKCNCQHWTRVLCDILGISKELENEPTFNSKLKRADTVATGILGFSAFCVVAALGWQVFFGRSSKDTEEEM